MNTRRAILRILADGKLHSGADVGAKVGVSRAAVCKAVKAIEECGLAVQAVSGRGYRLQAPLVLLDARRIARLLEGVPLGVRDIDVVEEVDSTNRLLMEYAQSGAAANGRVCLAEAQPRGRGRRGRSWVATPYQNLMLSMCWRFASGPAMVAGLSLAAGVAIVRALGRYGVNGARLKWPNDVLWNERKLAGLLVDLSGEVAGPCTVVLGVGINCRLAPADARAIDQPWADIGGLLGATVDRNMLAARVIEELYRMFEDFAVHGLAGFRAEWERYHLYADRPVRVLQGEELFDGTVEGVDDNGALRVRDARGQQRSFHSGEVSLRVAVK